MFCQKCGKYLADNAKFCQYCGQKIEWNRSEVPNQKGAKGKKKKRIGLIVGALIGTTGVLVGVFGFSMKKTVNTSDYVQDIAEESVVAQEDVEPAEEEETFAHEGEQLGPNDTLNNDQNEVYKLEEYVIKSSITYNEKGEVNYISEYKYGDDGKLIEKSNYYRDGSLERRSEYDYTTDARGNQMKIEYCYNNQGELWYWIEYEYNEAGNEIRIRYEDDYWIEYEYDGYGNRVAGTRHGAVTTDYKYENDNLGRCVKWLIYNIDHEVSHWFEYEYDENGNNIKATYYAVNGSLIQWEEFEYMLLEKSE